MLCAACEAARIPEASKQTSTTDNLDTDPRNCKPVGDAMKDLTALHQPDDDRLIDLLQNMQRRVDELEQQNRQQRDHIQSLTNKLSLVLSYLGIGDENSSLTSPVQITTEASELQAAGGNLATIETADNDSVITVNNGENDSGTGNETKQKQKPLYAEVVKRVDMVTTAPVYRAVLEVVSNELSDRSKRSRNIVVSGVPIN